MKQQRGSTSFRPGSGRGTALTPNRMEETYEGADEAKLTPRTVRREGRKPVPGHESGGVRDDESACNLITVNSEIEDLLSSEKSASMLQKRETDTPPKRDP